jgi:hypothetical protein
MLFILLLISWLIGDWVISYISFILTAIDRSGSKQGRGWFLYFLGAVKKLLFTVNAELCWPDK